MSMTPQERLETARIVQEAYPDFWVFCAEALEVLGFKATWQQLDIARSMQHDLYPYGMVMAQRGEAKSTIACIYAVWNLVQYPSHRIMLVSASGGKADENGMLIYKLVHQWDMLEYMQPDKTAGDRTSTSHFDIHWTLRGIDKSASVTCMGITSSLSGFRADLLIPDDVESPKNGTTVSQRNNLEQLTREFTDICSDGQILYLGTPQSKDSIYNNLPARGYVVRIWPGRYPTPAEMPKYGSLLAPSIAQRMQELGPSCQTGGGLDGDRGQITDPDRYTEQQQQDKELDKGPENYQLQYMLDTSLVDALRKQLHINDLIFAGFSHTEVPENVGWANMAQNEVQVPGWLQHKHKTYGPAFISTSFAPIENMVMYVDPSGGGDEVGINIGGTLGPYIHWVHAAGYRGGFEVKNLQIIVDLCKQYGVKVVHVEKNFGAGAVGTIIKNYFKEDDPATGRPRLTGVGVEDDSAGNFQKEKRIMDTLRPVLQRHRLIVHYSAVASDDETSRQYGSANQERYSVFYQLRSLTTDRGSLEVDDRLDSLSGLVKVLTPHLIKDEHKEAEARAQAAAKEFEKNPMDLPKRLLKPVLTGARGRMRRKQ